MPKGLTRRRITLRQTKSLLLRMTYKDKNAWLKISRAFQAFRGGSDGIAAGPLLPGLRAPPRRSPRPGIFPASRALRLRAWPPRRAASEPPRHGQHDYGIRAACRAHRARIYRIADGRPIADTPPPPTGSRYRWRRAPRVRSIHGTGRHTFRQPRQNRPIAATLRLSRSRRDSAIAKHLQYGKPNISLLPGQHAAPNSSLNSAAALTRARPARKQTPGRRRLFAREGRFYIILQYVAGLAQR